MNFDKFPICCLFRFPLFRSESSYRSPDRPSDRLTVGQSVGFVRPVARPSARPSDRPPVGRNCPIDRPAVRMSARLPDHPPTRPPDGPPARPKKNMHIAPTAYVGVRGDQWVMKTASPDGPHTDGFVDGHGVADPCVLTSIVRGRGGVQSRITSLGVGPSCTPVLFLFCCLRIA